MARFSEIQQGTRAIKVIDLPLANVPHGLQAGTPEQARERELNPTAYPTVKVGVRALLPLERELVLELAAARTKDKGGEVSSANPIYNHALAIYTVAASYVDPDTPPGKDAQLYFGDTIEQAAQVLRTSKHMTDDIVFYLRQRQEMWQDEINPQALTLGADKMFDATRQAVESDDFLSLMRPGLLVSFTRTLAAQLLILLQDRLASTTTDEQPGIAS